ncbi:glycosyltransferase family A protein [Gemmatimonadota bacterium]
MSVVDFPVSVIVPVFNSGQYAAEALESVFDQTVRPLEIIVVDSSNDETRDILLGFGSRIRYLYQEKQGIGGARNLGIRSARGGYLAHLDSDDVWMREKLARQAAAFAEDPALEIVGTLMEPFFSPDTPQELRDRIHCSPEPVPGFSPSAIVVKKDAFGRVGPYGTHWKVGQELDWFIRAREAGLMEAVIPEVLVRRRLHGNNTDLLNRHHGVERVQILKAALDRKRKTSMGGES